MRVQRLDHPLVEDHMSSLRSVESGPELFRATVRRLSSLLVYEATRDLPVRRLSVRTPMASLSGKQIAGRVGLVPILRAGLGMVDAVLEFLPGAEVWHLGFYRDEATLEPVEYYKKLPARRPVSVALVLDPMLATGGSAQAAIEAVRDWGVQRIKLLALLAAPAGIRRVTRAFPDLDVHVCAIDRKLDRNGFIVPGLGDAGDRLFNAQA
ncbi:MAG: uracil phosphoribosyltransferase [Kiritimatiellia bacterium]|nr:uracil phosphoribosyltransferase [Kiritimatiellia bacterium]